MIFHEYHHDRCLSGGYVHVSHPPVSAVGSSARAFGAPCQAGRARNGRIKLPVALEGVVYAGTQSPAPSPVVKSHESR